MLTRTQTQSALKTWSADLKNISPDAAREVTEVLVHNLKQWGELVWSQAQAVQVAATESVAACQHVKDPQAAAEIMMFGTQKALVFTARYLQQIVGLSVEQFNSGLDLMQKSHPAPDSFSELVQVMRVTASTMESATLSLLNAGLSPSADRTL